MEHEETIELFDKYDILGQYEILLDRYTECLFYEGLDMNDDGRIYRIIEELAKLKVNAYFDYKENLETLKSVEKKNYLKKVDNILQNFLNLEDQLQNNIEPLSLSNYLQYNCSLVHLVATNNKHEKIKLYATDDFRFLCQFHKEKTPSLGISNLYGISYCFGCGCSFNIIGYIKSYENLTFHETVCLLSRVYLIDIENNCFEDNDPLVVKYREFLISDKFKQLLIRGYKKSFEKYRNTRVRARISAICKYERIFKTINRIKRNEHIKFINKDEKPKKLILQMPTFEQNN